MSATQNTKIELLAEAIETLVAVTVSGQLTELKGGDARKQFELVREARAALADSVRTLLTPVMIETPIRKPPLHVVKNDNLA